MLGPSDGRRRGERTDDNESGKTNEPGKTETGKGESGKAGNSSRTSGKTSKLATTLGWSATPFRLRLALLASVAGAALTFIGVRLGLVADEPAPAFASGAWLLILAAAPAVLAIVCVTVGRATAAAGILAGAALLAPGLALVDAQFISDALVASRPELMVPTSLAPLSPATGAYLLLAGHIVTAVAGLLAAGRAGADPDSDYFAALDASTAAAGRGRAVGWALAAGSVSIVGLMFPPFSSDNAFIVAHDLIASPALVRFGGLLIALTLLIGGVAAAANTRTPVARGMVAGLFLALAWLVVPQLVAVASVDWLHLERGAPLFALIPVGLLVFATGDRDTDEHDVQVEGSPIVTGVLGALTGIATLLGAFTSLVVSDVDQPESYANRQLLPAGIVILVLSALLFTRWAGAVRPAFVVALGALPLVGLAALDTAFTATTVGTLIPGFPVATSNTHVGAAVWYTIAAFVLATVAAIAAVVSGGNERDDDVGTGRWTLHLRYAIPAGGAVLFALGAFTSPMIKAAGYTPPGILTEFRLASWGLLIGLIVIVGAAVLAAFARPARAAALLLGAAVVAGVHLLELPLTGGRVAGAGAGAGTWLTLACLVALVAAAVAAFTDPARTGE
jgi:hypothetical protein